MVVQTFVPGTEDDRTLFVPMDVGKRQIRIVIVKWLIRSQCHGLVRYHLYLTKSAM